MVYGYAAPNAQDSVGAVLCGTTVIETESGPDYSKVRLPNETYEFYLPNASIEAAPEERDVAVVPQSNAPTEDAKAVAQREQLAAEREQQQRQSRISQLQNDVEQYEQEAAGWDSKVGELGSSNNCTGLGAALCQGIGSFGAAKARQNAAQARQRAQNAREEIARLRDMPVQHVSIDTSFASALQQQQQQEPTASIQDTVNQQTANIYRVGAANDAARQPVAQQSPPADPPRAKESPQPANPGVQVITFPARSSSTVSSAGSNASATSCTDASSLVTARAKLAGDGMVVGYLTNNSNQTLLVSTTFVKDGKPLRGQTVQVTIKPGMTVGGEAGGVWVPRESVDYPPSIVKYAVPWSQADQNCREPW
jgi:hypothetical protein